MRCKNCGAENDDSRYICEVCGSPLYDENELSAQADQQPAGATPDGAPAPAPRPNPEEDKKLQQKNKQSMIIIIVFRAIKWSDIDEQIEGGIRLMGQIAIIMLVAGGYASVIKATGGIDALVNAGISAVGGSKAVAAVVITLIGLLVTMGIGTSFGTVPVLAVLFVPMCSSLGFSTPATILLISAAAALGDAGSPASDTTLGPTSGLNADGQHDHIRDTCIPTFIAFNIPIMICAILMSQVL